MDLRLMFIKLLDSCCCGRVFSIKRGAPVTIRAVFEGFEPLLSGISRLVVLSFSYLLFKPLRDNLAKHSFAPETFGVLFSSSRFQGTRPSSIGEQA